MSWIFAYFGNNVNSAVSGFRNLQAPAVHEIQRERFFVAAGGNDETISKNIGEDKQNRIVCGIGLVNSNQTIKYADNTDWESFVADPVNNEMSGHYTGLTWNEKEVKVFTDRTGLRDIYYAKTHDGIVISTRPDWLREFTNLEINFREFSTRWILFNQISHKSILDGSKRLTAGSGIKFNLLTYIIEEFCNTFNYPDQLPREQNLECRLKQYLESASLVGKGMSLSLSGGMDSRALLSILKNSQNENWDTHTFGPPDHPDSRTASGITNGLQIRYRQINLPQPPFETILTELKEYAASTLVNNPASAIMQLRNYNELRNKNYAVMDGGFGEIWRREFLFKLELRGAKAIREGNGEEITKYMRHFRSDIFNSEINDLMDLSSIEQVKEAISTLPLPQNIGIGNWLDFLAIKTRLPNYYGHEQARLDELISAVMPFAQPEMFELLFSYPVELRRNGKLFKEIINTNCPKLKSYPLVKGVVTSPYGLSSFQSRIYSLISKKIKRNSYIDNRTNDFLTLFKDYIYDITNSTNFNNCEFYDHKNIKTLVSEYYKGDIALANQLDWFLSFELFRQSINSNKT